MSNTMLIVIGVVVLLILLVLVLRSRGSDTGAPPVDHDEGDGVTDGFKAAVEDVAGEFVGVEINPDTPGDTEVRRDPGDGSGSVASTARGGAGDALSSIKGLGPKAEAKLRDMGVVRFEQIAGWTEADLETLDTDLGLRERAERDRWVEQAGLLARGETAAFEEKFGKLG
ncbi:MAG: hypothetical protein HKN78_06330 [Sphingomonadaceae bacterium]|nr:hypothetical protein [Sphingomonadaceae bacterium]